jgi:hypothetical protein
MILSKFMKLLKPDTGGYVLVSLSGAAAVPDEELDPDEPLGLDLPISVQ